MEDPGRIDPERILGLIELSTRFILRYSVIKGLVGHGHQDYWGGICLTQTTTLVTAPLLDTVLLSSRRRTGIRYPRARVRDPGDSPGWGRDFLGYSQDQGDARTPKCGWCRELFVTEVGKGKWSGEGDTLRVTSCVRREPRHNTLEGTCEHKTKPVFYTPSHTVNLTP